MAFGRLAAYAAAVACISAEGAAVGSVLVVVAVAVAVHSGPQRPWLGRLDVAAIGAVTFLPNDGARFLSNI